MAVKTLLVAGKALLASGLGVVCSFLISAAMGPFVIEGTDVGAHPPQPGEIVSMEQLRKVEEEAKSRMKARSESFKTFEGQAIMLRSMQRAALWLSWIPWFLLPFIFRITTATVAAMVLCCPIVLVVLTVAPIEVLPVFAFALGVGVLARNKYGLRGTAA